MTKFKEDTFTIIGLPNYDDDDEPDIVEEITHTDTTAFSDILKRLEQYRQGKIPTKKAYRDFKLTKADH